ncbi:hypothetical protein [Sulfuricurvum sp.]|uniref:hypothetical protein n=1 Tax=Sulfuricurvum sp. TaxID=2025608 RepID=UPI00260B178B|nr:hypothetical protein [Sulfuricurvum sp.]MDD3596986.1 hypothetical protein [Sulfuricurvum sp.]
MSKPKPKRLDQSMLLKLKQYRGSVTMEQADEFIELKRSLPAINKEPFYKRNRKGVLCEIIGTKGTVKTIGVAKHGNVIYFDGNRLGKRKMIIVNGLFGGEIPKGFNPAKVWNKIGKQSI